MREYIPLLMLMGFVVVNAVVMLGFSQLVSPHGPTAIKQTPYEPGMSPLGFPASGSRSRSIFVARLFIKFDIQTVFVIPWPVAFRRGGLRWE